MEIGRASGTNIHFTVNTVLLLLLLLRHDKSEHIARPAMPGGHALSKEFEGHLLR